MNVMTSTSSSYAAPATAVNSIGERKSGCAAGRSRVCFRKHVKQISQGKQRETKNGAREVEVVTNAMLIAPMHPRKQMKGFTDVGEDDHSQTSCAE
jgi:hypothetical protein